MAAGGDAARVSVTDSESSVKHIANKTKKPGSCPGYLSAMAPGLPQGYLSGMGREGRAIGAVLEVSC